MDYIEKLIKNIEQILNKKINNNFTAVFMEKWYFNHKSKADGSSICLSASKESGPVENILIVPHRNQSSQKLESNANQFSTLFNSTYMKSDMHGSSGQDEKRQLLHSLENSHLQ